MNENLIDRLDTALHDIFRALNADRLPVHREGAGFSAKNLSLMEIRILRLIHEAEVISLKAIRSAVGIPNSSLTSVIHKFENKGLITRTKDPADRRSFLLAITDKGRRINEAHRENDRKCARVFIERVGDEQLIEQFIRITKLGASSALFSMEEFCAAAEENEG
ncbi:MAG: MarR family transcriptional regulator [Christensenellaceae bacterium]|nr:MarR family transcriptional regulator [Christensenellaceae bacterium]